MQLTGKQKRVLRAMGQTMDDDAQLGQAGPTDAFVAHLRTLLDRKELIKLRFSSTKLEGSDRRDFASELCEALAAECVGVVGRTVLIYRANPTLEPRQRVKLPAREEG